MNRNMCSDDQRSGWSHFRVAIVIYTLYKSTGNEYVFLDHLVSQIALLFYFQTGSTVHQIALVFSFYSFCNSFDKGTFFQKFNLTLNIVTWHVVTSNSEYKISKIIKSHCLLVTPDDEEESDLIRCMLTVITSFVKWWMAANFLWIINNTSSSDVSSYL